MRSVVVVADEKPGLLGEMSYVLSKSGVNIDGVDVDIIGGKAIFSLTVKDTNKAKSVLERNGYVTVEPDALVIKVSNSLRSLAEVMQMLERKRVRVEEYSEISSDGESGIFALMVNKRRKASRLLENFMIGAVPG